MSTITGISHDPASFGETLRNRSIPATTSGHICSDTKRKLLSLHTRFRGLAIYSRQDSNHSN